MFHFTSIEQYHAQLQEETFTCAQAVQHYLQRISDTRHLNAFIHVYEAEALQRALDLDDQRRSGSPMGLLHGVVIGLKDVICYKDHPVSAASAILKDFHSVYSATVVENLLDAGAIIIGHLNCDEFAMGSSNENSFYGNVLNAIDETRVPGGSSGGSAVAVQAGLCMVSLGSDTGGSVRQPADFCGIIGLKPSYGRISRYGLIAYASSFDQIGIFSSTIPDMARLLQVVSGKDEKDSTSSTQPVPAYSQLIENPGPYRFAYFEEALEHPGLDPEIRNAIRQKINELSQEGHIVTAIPFEWLDFIVPAYYILTTAEASSNLARYDGLRFGPGVDDPKLTLTDFYLRTRSAGFGWEVKRRIMLGSFVLSTGFYDAYFTKAQKIRKVIFDKIELIFNDFDFILLPNSPCTAFKIGEKTEDPIAMYLADIYTVLANLCGIPAISLPLFQHSNGLPFGLQVMANRFNELTLLQVSKQLVKN